MFSRRRWSFDQASHHTKSSNHREDMRDNRLGRRDSSQVRKKIELTDLDSSLSGRQSVRIGINGTSQLGDVAESLKSRYLIGDHLIPKDAEIQFFWDDKRIDGDDVPKGASSLLYRVLPPGDDGGLRIICSANVKLRRSQIETIAREAREGNSVGSIRETTANLLQPSNEKRKHPVQDANQILVEAAGGLKPGPLHGSNWEARKAQTWLCRYLIIEVRTVFLILRGFNEQYVCHNPHLFNPRGYADVRMLKDWLRLEVLTMANPHGRHRRRISVDDIRLTLRGRAVRKHTHIRSGDIIDFEVPRVVEDKFLRTEAWLVPLSETCTVCGDEKRVSEMPNRRRVTAACEHDSLMCKECVGKWIASSMDTSTWDRLKCPECPQLLKFENVRAFATREVFERYDTLATKAALTSIPEFMWCLNPRCNSGQIHPVGCSKAKCHACKHHNCVRHNVPWHKGETCEEYEQRTRIQRRNDKASEQHIKEITKPCPGCKRNIHKYTGCDHVTCVCGHEWCWLCFGTYYRDERQFLQCHHTQECRYHDNPPNYEGGRAFMPFLQMGGAPPPFMPLGPPRERRGGAARGEAGDRPQAPRHLPLDDEDPIEFIMRRRRARNPFEPDIDLARPRQQPRAPGPALFEEAMRFNLGHIMQRAERP
ncbi:hypothetical protein AAE478_002227 [Parahypoxylon ruwenzoriense]